MLNAIAIDDEPFALEVVKSLAEQVPFISLNACFTKSLEALTYLQENTVQLIFLDIKMPGMSGIEFIRALPNPPMVVFTTAYSEHAVQSFELDAIDYILKPFSLPRFLKACNKAFEQYKLRNTSNIATPGNRASIFIKSGYEQIRIELTDVLYAESIGNYVRFNLSSETITSRLTMTEAEALLPMTAFVRIHRSFIVAKAKITKIDKRSVWIRQKELPIGSAYSEKIQLLILNK